MNFLKNYESVSIINVPDVINPLNLDNLNNQLDLLNLESKNIIIFKPSKKGIFCSGMDLSWVINMNLDKLEDNSKKFSKLIKKIKNLPCITIAMIDGEVIGGGLGIVSVCDIAISSSRSKFQLSEGLFGFTPAMIIPALKERISNQQIKKMVFLAKIYSAKNIKDIGLVDEVLEIIDLEEHIIKLIKKLQRCQKQSVVDLKELLIEKNDFSQKSVEKASKFLRNAMNKSSINNLKSISYLMKHN